MCFLEKSSMSKETADKRSKQAKTMSGTKGSAENTENKQTESFRRGIRASYQAIHNRIHEGKDEIASVDSSMFKTILKDVENLHQHVVKPREQVVDAEVILNLASTLLNSAKSHSLGVFTPADFVSSIIRQFPGDSQERQSGNAADLICWKDIGLAAAPVFMKGKGCLTMIGPMDLKFQPRKPTVLKSYARLIEKNRPKEVNSTSEEKTQTDMDIAVMFNILKKKNPVKLENLILNRHSFAQTVENLFALSFLVRDGRVVVEVDDNGSHLVSPRNAPDTYLVVRGEVKYSHFVFRFDFSDWKLMMDLVPVGEELMPHRKCAVNNPDLSERELVEEFESKDVQMLLDTPPVLLNNPDICEEECELKVFEMAADATPGLESSRKRGQFLLENLTAQDMPETGHASNPKCKRKLF